jgi:hypothetical protein
MKKSGYITLKWGTIKAWNFFDNPKAQGFLEEYFKIGSSASAMLQHDTPRQKELICKMIDAVPGKILLDWDRKRVTKKEAKKYVMEYSNG